MTKDEERYAHELLDEFIEFVIVGDFDGIARIIAERELQKDKSTKCWTEGCKSTFRLRAVHEKDNDSPYIKVRWLCFNCRREEQGMPRVEIPGEENAKSI